MFKIGDGNENNYNPSYPGANLWLCLSPAPCSGPGEGDLRVVEYAFNVLTQDQDGDLIPDGLGAYEFQVEYDNFVIQSLNPCDLVFGDLSSFVPPGETGYGYTRGPVDELNSSASNPDCRDDANVVSDGTCTMSLILENIIRFGCVTVGQTPGPQGAGPLGNFPLASLDLIPHPDLANDIFPGNNNGVVTVIKDNGCELVDVFGHPVLLGFDINGDPIFTQNGGLTPICGDLAVTVRILEGDLNLDCKVDVTDEQLISYRYGAFFGDILYTKWFDLEPALHDLDIDIKDLQKVFGRDGSTCQIPIPAQLPQPPPVPFGN